MDRESNELLWNEARTSRIRAECELIDYPEATQYPLLLLLVHYLEKYIPSLINETDGQILARFLTQLFDANGRCQAGRSSSHNEHIKGHAFAGLTFGTQCACY